MNHFQGVYSSVEDAGPLKRKLTYLLKNACDVEDVIQDTYLRVLEFQQGDNVIDNIKAFFNRVAHNIAIDRVRRRGRTDHIFVPADESDDVRGQLMRICSPEQAADSRLENKQALETVLAAIAELPANCGRAYLLSCAHELTYAEIAAELGVTVSMIEKYIARARRYVRDRVPPMYRLHS